VPWVAVVSGKYHRNSATRGSRESQGIILLPTHFLKKDSFRR
jgi:hypothetical protein